MNKAILIILSISLISFISKESKNQSSSNLPLGTVIYNILPPEIFLESEEGKDFALLDGREMKPSWNLTQYINNELSILQHLNDTLPDARGMFIRSMTYNDERVISKERKVGEIQNDAIKEHRHSFSFQVNNDGNHSHDIVFSDQMSSPVSFYQIPSRAEAFVPNEYVPAFKQKGDGVTYHDQMTQWESTDSPGTHSHYYSGDTEKNTGSKSETRPKNIAFYCYIKIN
jgi:hypothetical protein